MNSIVIDFCVKLVVINSYTRRHNPKTIILIATARSESDSLLKFSTLKGIYKLLVLLTGTGIMVRVIFFCTGEAIFGIDNFPSNINSVW
jgi:hypothetical protein